MLTATSWEDRLLGVNRIVRAPLYVTWFATGNNVAIAADTARRVCHIRLESPEERPENRSGFRHPDLLRWVGENRQRLLGAAITILRAYFCAGRPDQGAGPRDGCIVLLRLGRPARIHHRRPGHRRMRGRSRGPAPDHTTNDVAANRQRESTILGAAPAAFRSSTGRPQVRSSRAGGDSFGKAKAPGATK